MRPIERRPALQGSTAHLDRSWSRNLPAIHGTDVAAAVVLLIDGDAEESARLRQTLEAHSFDVQVFADSQSFQTSHHSGRRGCILVDVSMPGNDGIELIKLLKANNCGLAVIATASHLAPARVVEAMRAGASDCLERPIRDDVLLNAVRRGIGETDAMVDHSAYRSLAIQRVGTLTARQREILNLITMGHPSKNIAADLRISQRTVENHRAAIARKTCAKSLSEVVHTAICANCSLMKARN
jgi:two-component system CheB/CheR fusion protein